MVLEKIISQQKMKDSELLARIDERVGILVIEMPALAKRVRKVETKVAWIMGIGTITAFGIGIFVTIIK